MVMDVDFDIEMNERGQIGRSKKAPGGGSSCLACCCCCSGSRAQLPVGGILDADRV